MTWLPGVELEPTGNARWLFDRCAIEITKFDYWVSHEVLQMGHCLMFIIYTWVTASAAILVRGEMVASLWPYDSEEYLNKT